MRAKTFKEAIITGITIGPMQECVSRITNEVIDLIAHEAMLFAKDLKMEQQLIIINFVSYLKGKKE